MIRLSPALPLQLDRPARCAQAPEPHRATPTALSECSGDLAMDDWKDLFRAVTDQLRHTVSPADVLECVAALDQLGATLTQQIGHCRQQRDVAQAALAQALDACANRRDEQPYARHLARHGSLTALPERRTFHDDLEQALGDPAQRDAIAVLYLGLEGLEALHVASDPQAPALADELLWAVGARLTRAVRAEDRVSHFGEGEFACLLVVDVPGREILSQIACKLFDLLSAPWRFGTRTLTLRPSIGIASGLGGGSSAAAWLSRADAAMVRARALGLGHAFDDSRIEPNWQRRPLTAAQAAAAIGGCSPG